MPRTTKEKTENLNKKSSENSSKKSISKAKKTTEQPKKLATEEKVSTKKSTSTTKKKTTTTKKDTTSTKKKTTTTKKAASSTKSKTTKTKTAAKTANSTTKKSAVKKPVAKKTTSTTLKKQSFLSEYYDLPYKYNKTVVKILAQTPTKLFIYWEISDEDRNSFIAKYGNDFFNITKPVLIIHNLTMNYSFELDINDFANCWYVSINDADCLYSVELGRRPFNLYEKINEPYIYVSSSNNLQTPNNHILFENINSNTVFKIKNIKTNAITTIKIDTLPRLANIAKTYNNDFYNYYTKLYSKDLIAELNDTKLNNPSSGAISSFK